MKDPNDTKPLDAFESHQGAQEPAKRGPGRPSTGQAKTAAQRMKEHRRRRRMGETGAGDNGERVLNTSLRSEAFFALHRLARRNGVTQKEFLEKLLVELDNEITHSFELDSNEWKEYFETS